MDSIITFFCIIGLCVFVYAYQMMNRDKRDYPHRCKVLYVPRHDEVKRERLPHTEVLDHEAEDEKFLHARFSTAPMGISEVESILPSANVRYDTTNVGELGD